MEQTPRKQDRTPRTQNRENQQNRPKSDRSKLGQILYDELLRGDGRKLRQSELAEKMKLQGVKVQESIITALMYHPKQRTADPIPYGQKAYDFFYGMFKALDTLHVPLTEGQVSRFLKAANPSEHHTHITESQQKALIARLKKEAIIKQRYLTRDQMTLIGRERNIQKIMSLLQDEGRRLLTLVGAPGVGKTELAWQIGMIAQEQNMQMHIFYLELERYADEILLKINLYLHGIDSQQPTLLILDNCEQIIDEEIIKLMRALEGFISKYRKLTILLTSRVRFNDNYYEVPTLDVPSSINESPGTLKNYAGVQLFLERGKIAEDDFTKYAKQIAAISIALDGIPLAINMAASWVKQLKIDGIYQGLVYNQPTEDKDGIQEMEYYYYDQKYLNTLETVIKWSYDLLKDDEQMLFRWLSVFPRHCEIDSVRTICTLGDFPTNKHKPINILKKLHNHSLLRFEEQQIDMHNTIRTYGRRRMDNIFLSITSAPRLTLQVDPFGNIGVFAQHSPREEAIDANEAAYLRALFMINVKASEFSYFINHSYNREELEKRAEDDDFLDEPTEDNIIMKQLRSILFGYTYDELDIFRLRGKIYQYPPFIEEVVQEYKERQTEPLSGKEARKLFFDIFDEIYPSMLLGMLLEEADQSLERFEELSQNPPWNGQTWPVFDRFMGLAIS